MNYPKTDKYDKNLVKNKIMGPNPLKLLEELMLNLNIPEQSAVCDLGSGQGLTSVFLAKEFNFKVTAADLWSDPEENKRFFDEMGVPPENITPVKADATDLPFKPETFDAVISTDSYNYFGRDKDYLDAKLLPCVKKGGMIAVCIPGMKKDLHDNLPEVLLRSWTPEQLDYIHDTDYWKEIVGACKGAEVIEVKEMESNDEVWKDWLECDNEYAIGDRATMENGGGKYLNFIKIVLRKNC